MTLSSITSHHILSLYTLCCFHISGYFVPIPSLLNQGNQLKIKYWNNAFRGANAVRLHIICSIQESQIKLSNNKMAYKCSSGHYCYILYIDQKSMGEISLLLSLSASIRESRAFLFSSYKGCCSISHILYQGGQTGGPRGVRALPIFGTTNKWVLKKSTFAIVVT